MRKECTERAAHGVDPRLVTGARMRSASMLEAWARGGTIVVRRTCQRWIYGDRGCEALSKAEQGSETVVKRFKMH